MAAYRTNEIPGPTWWTVLGAIFREPDYRAIMIALLLMGLSIGLVLPYVTLWVTRGLHGTAEQAAFMFVPPGLLGIIVNIGVAAYSDRIGRRKGIIIVALVSGGAFRLGTAFAPSYPVALALFAFTGFTPFALVFALLRDAINSKQDSATTETGAFITTLERTAFSLGWLIGPVLGGVIVANLGYRALFMASSLLFFLGALWAGMAFSDYSHHHSARRGIRAPLRAAELGLLALLFFAGLSILAGDRGRSMFLPLHLTAFLRLPISSVSWAFSATVLAELLFMPLAGRMADRFGVTRVLVAGIIGEVLYFLGLAESNAYWQILCLQVGYAFVVSTSFGVAIVFAQRTLGSERSGLTTSTYLVSGGLAPVLNDLLVGGTRPSEGFSRLFLALALLALIALAIVLFIASRSRRRV